MSEHREGWAGSTFERFRSLRLRTCAALLCFAAPIPSRAQSEDEGATDKDRHFVSFPALDGSTLGGYYFVPGGTGPFPAVLWNHGSERHPGSQSELANFYVSRGFVFFVPHRRGQGRSPGPYIMDEIRGTRGAAVVAAQERASLDVDAALRWLYQRPEVDSRRVVVSGCSFGGIQTILAAERFREVRAFVAFAPGAMSWSEVRLRERLERALSKASAPVLIVQAQNDFDLGPSEDLGRIAATGGGRSIVYPAFGSSHRDGHWGFATSRAGIDIWADDVMAFIATAMGTDRR